MKMVITMAIDIEQFMLDIYTPMIDYSGADQLLLANQKVPDDQLKDDRIIYNMIVSGNTGGRHTVIKQEEVVPHEGDEGFDYDIGRHNIFFPEATLSITGYNNTTMELAKLRDWFYIKDLAAKWFKEQETDCVVRQVMEINDRTVYLESDYEKRHGFDVILEFKDIVTVAYRTIEYVEVHGLIDKTIDI